MLGVNVAKSFHYLIITNPPMSNNKSSNQKGEEISDKKKIFILTDSCMWEANKQAGKSAPHAIEVVDIGTGQIRYIKSGSQIKFISGEISEKFSQEEYNKGEKLSTG